MPNQLANKPVVICLCLDEKRPLSNILIRTVQDAETTLYEV